MINRSEYVAEEIIQEVFIKLWSVRESIPQEVSFKAYLYRTVRNKALNYLRDAARRDALYEVYKQDVPDDSETTAYMVAWAELEKQLNDLINKLPPQASALFIFFDHLALADVDFPVKTICSRKHYFWTIFLVLFFRLGSARIRGCGTPSSIAGLATTTFFRLKSKKIQLACAF